MEIEVSMHIVLKYRNALNISCLHFSIPRASMNSNTVAASAGQAVLFHFLSCGQRSTKDNSIEELWLRRDDKRWDPDLRGQEPRTGEQTNDEN